MCAVGTGTCTPDANFDPVVAHGRVFGSPGDRWCGLQVELITYCGTTRVDECGEVVVEAWNGCLLIEGQESARAVPYV